MPVIARSAATKQSPAALNSQFLPVIGDCFAANDAAAKKQNSEHCSSPVRPKGCFAYDRAVVAQATMYAGHGPAWSFVSCTMSGGHPPCATRNDEGWSGGACFAALLRNGCSFFHSEWLRGRRPPPGRGLGAMDELAMTDFLGGARTAGMEWTVPEGTLRGGRFSVILGPWKPGQKS